jgi:hypothetical protein
MIQKILRYAEHLGLDREELLQMTMLEAILLIENTKDMWKEVKQLG